MTPDDAELAARRAALAQTHPDIYDVLGPLIGSLSIPMHAMAPDFDEPMELVESRRLRALEALERAHQAICPNCGHPLPGGTPAQDAPTTPTEETRTASATIAPSQWDICLVCDLPTLYCRGH